MNFKKFFSYLVLVIFVSGSIIQFVYTIAGKEKIANVFIIGFFTVFSIVLYLISIYAIKSKDNHLFTRIFLISVFLKIVFFVFIILYCVRKLSLDKKELIIPSLFVYVCFTIFETYMLMLISKPKMNAA